MSDVSQGPGWWQASDGKWYPPDQVPGTGAAEPEAPATEAVPQPTYPGEGVPAYPGPGPGDPLPGPAPGGPLPGPAPAPAYGPPPAGGYGYPPAGTPYGYPRGPKNNGLAIAAMVCSFFFWVYGLGAILGIVFGFIARGQIKRSNGTQRGDGMALAGIIIGFVGIAIAIVVIILVIAFAHSCNNQPGNYCFNTN